MSLINIEFRIHIHRRAPDTIVPYSPEWRLFVEDAIKERIRAHGLVDWERKYRPNAHIEEGYASCGSHPIREKLEEI